MHSRLFRAFRILKIRADTEDEIAAMLDLLQLPAAPVLHVLQIEWISRYSTRLVGFSPSLSFPFVKVLSLQAPEASFKPAAMAHFPCPRLQVLEIAQTRFPLELLHAWLPLLPSTLRQLVIRPPKSRCVEDRPRLLTAIEAALPELTEIHWLHQLDPRHFVDEIRQWKSDHAGALPQLHKIRSVHCLAIERFTGDEDHVLRVFSALEELVLSFRLHIPFHDSAVNDSFIHRQLSIAGLSQLRRLTLRQISELDDRQMTTPLTGFHRVLASMPLLEELDLGNLAVPLSAFAHVPRLRTLSMRFLSGCHDDETLTMAQFFPSLITLCMPSDPASRVFYSAVRQMPKLQTVQIRNLTPRPREEFVRDGLAAYAALEAESARQEREALKTSGWVHSLGSSATAAAAAAVVNASAVAFVEWRPAEPTRRVPTSVGAGDSAFYLGVSKSFSPGTAATHANKTKPDKHAAAAATTDVHAQPMPSSTPFSFGPPPAHATAPSAFPVFDFASLSSALPAPSAAASSSFHSSFAASPLATAPFAAPAAFASSAFVFAPPPPPIASAVSAAPAAVALVASSASSAAASSSPDAACA